MTLPEFPYFTEIDLSFKDVISRYLSAYPLGASEYTFTNLFAFRDAYNFKVSLYKDIVMVLKDKGPVCMFCPIGGPGAPDAVAEGFKYLRHFPDRPCFERIPESFVKSHLISDQRFMVDEEREHFDYVYDTGDLIDLKGRKFHDKKNKVNKFRSTYQYKYAALTPGMIRECLKFEEYWCEERECEKYYGLHRERCAILEMLNNFELLNMKGGIIRVDNKIVALTLGEKLLPDTFVIHIEKASSSIPGLYQVINQEFLMHEAADCAFVNREQDLGIEGLRNSKMSYNPVRFIKKYRVSER